METGPDPTPMWDPSPHSQVATADRRQALSAHYPAITETAEHLIRALIVRHTAESRGAALGVWQLWYGLTVGYQNEGDSERLERLLFPNTEATA